MTQELKEASPCRSEPRFAYNQPLERMVRLLRKAQLKEAGNRRLRLRTVYSRAQQERQKERRLRLISSKP